MWSQKLKSGNVCYYERYKDPLTEKVKTATITIKPSGRKKTDERIAEEALREKIKKNISNIMPDSETLTLDELMEKYIIRQRQEYKAQTAASSKMHLSTVKKLLGGDTLVCRLNAPLVREKLWDDDPVTYNGRLKIFKSMMHWAYKADLVPDISYISKLTRRKTAPVRYKDAEKYLEHEEITKLLSGMKIERWRNLTEFLLLSGMRIGEAIGLDDSDVDIPNRVIHVTKTYAVVIRKITNSAKTDASVRDIYMQDELLSICKKIKKFEKQRQIQFVYRTKLFISDDNGDYINYSVFSKYFRENTENLLGRRLTPHSLRHTHTALLAEAEIPLEEISRRLGHVDSKITKDVYMHVTEKMKQRSDERIKNVKMLDIC